MAVEKQWNDDPEWVDYIFTLDPVIEAIAAKYTDDYGLREDCAQEARMELLYIFPEKHISAYEKFRAGKLTEAQWEKKRDSFCRMVIRNTIITFLNSYKSGPWQVGRKVRRVDRYGNATMKRKSARFASMDDLMEDYGMQIDTEGNISWPEVRYQPEDETWE